VVKALEEQERAKRAKRKQEREERLANLKAEKAALALQWNEEDQKKFDAEFAEEIDYHV